MSIGSNIKRLREARNVTQKELGEAVGVTDKAVSTWELGIKDPRMGTIQKLADYFGVSKSDIIEDRFKDEDLIRLDADELEFLREIRERPEMKVMFSVTKNTTKEDLIKAIKIIEALKNTEE